MYSIISFLLLPSQQKQQPVCVLLCDCVCEYLCAGSHTQRKVQGVPTKIVNSESFLWVGDFHSFTDYTWVLLNVLQ